MIYAPLGDGYGEHPIKRKRLLARVLGVLISEMAISESYGREFRRSVEWWGER